MEKNFSVFLNTNDTNNICTTISEDTEDDLLEFSCFVRDPLFSVFTLLFIYLPSGSVVGSVLGNDDTTSLLANIFSAIFFELNFILLLCKLFLGGMTLSLILLFSLFFGFLLLVSIKPYHRYEAYRHFCQKKSQFFIIILTYPLLLVVSPFLVIIVKFRSILPHNIHVLQLKRDLSLGESSLEAAPQLCLQLYIVLTRFDRVISTSQWLSIVASLLSLALPAIETFLANKKIYGFKNIVKYLPVFFLNMVFRVLSVSVTTTFFRGGFFVIFFLNVVVIYCGMVIWIRVIWRRIEVNFEYSKSTVGLLLASLFSITNLGNTKEDRIFRKWSTYWVTGFHTATLLITMILCNLGVEAKAVELGIDWTDLPLLKQYLDSLNIIIIVTVSMGLGSLLLDFCIYKHCLNSPVFFDELEIEEEFSVCYYCCWGTIGYLKSVC